jgi:hypothetical protein
MYEISVRNSPTKLTGGNVDHRGECSKFYVLPTQCIHVFCVDLRTNSDYFPMQHQLTVFYNGDGECLLRGTDSVFII